MYIYSVGLPCLQSLSILWCSLPSFQAFCSDATKYTALPVGERTQWTASRRIITAMDVDARPRSTMSMAASSYSAARDMSMQCRALPRSIYAPSAASNAKLATKTKRIQNTQPCYVQSYLLACLPLPTPARKLGYLCFCTVIAARVHLLFILVAIE